MFYERLKEICASKGVKITVLIDDLGMSSGNLSSWKKGNTPRASTIDKIADYLGVSSDYLLGRSDDPVAQKNVQNGYVIQGLSKEEFDEITSYLDYLRSKK
ncbi:MAG: helix-turn-helix domain-containing protein [Christensenellales bacterium]